MLKLKRKVLRKGKTKKIKLIQTVSSYMREHWKAIASGVAAVGAGMYFMQTRPHKISKP